MKRKTHELKCWPEYFAAIDETKKKRFEIRKDDRDYQVGDHLKLREWDPKTGEYTGAYCTRTITYMAKGVFGLPEDVCVLSI